MNSGDKRKKRFHVIPLHLAHFCCTKELNSPSAGIWPLRVRTTGKLVAVSALSPLGHKYFQGRGPNHESPGSLPSAGHTKKMQTAVLLWKWPEPDGLLKMLAGWVFCYSPAPQKKNSSAPYFTTTIACTAPSSVSKSSLRNL